MARGWAAGVLAMVCKGQVTRMRIAGVAAVRHGGSALCCIFFREGGLARWFGAGKVLGASAVGDQSDGDRVCDVL